MRFPEGWLDRELRRYWGKTRSSWFVKTSVASRLYWRRARRLLPSDRRTDRAAFTGIPSRCCFERQAIILNHRAFLSARALNSNASPEQQGVFMKAVCWMGKEKIQVHDVPDP